MQVPPEVENARRRTRSKQQKVDEDKHKKYLEGEPARKEAEAAAEQRLQEERERVESLMQAMHDAVVNDNVVELAVLLEQHNVSFQGRYVKEQEKYQKHYETWKRLLDCAENDGLNIVVWGSKGQANCESPSIENARQQLSTAELAAKEECMKLSSSSSSITKLAQFKKIMETLELARQVFIDSISRSTRYRALYSRPLGFTVDTAALLKCKGTVHGYTVELDGLVYKVDKAFLLNIDSAFFASSLESHICWFVGERSCVLVMGKGVSIRDQSKTERSMVNYLNRFPNLFK